MSTFSVKTFKAVFDDIKTWVIANQDKISDFNDGSVIMSWSEAISRQFEQAYVRASVGFQKYLKNIPYDTFDFKKKEGLYSAGQVRFTCNAQATKDVTITSGTRAQTASGIEFVTTADATIPLGQTQSNLVNAVASKVGKDGNVPPLTITTLPSPITDVDGVTNPLSTTGGLDEESDFEFQKRFLDYIEGLGKSSGAGLITGAKKVNGVRSATMVEHSPALGGVYHGTLYVDDGTGSASAQILADVTSIINGDGSETNPGYRAAGLKYRILSPTKVLIDITVTVVSDGTLDKVYVKQNVEKALTDYINSLPIGKDVIANRLVDVIMSEAGVYDQDLTDPGTNIEISDSQIARIGTLAVTVT